MRRYESRHIFDQIVSHFSTEFIYQQYSVDLISTFTSKLESNPMNTLNSRCSSICSCSIRTI